MSSTEPTDVARSPAAPPSPSRRWSWEAYSVIVATIVGLLSLAVSAYTAYTLHLQTRAQVYPYVQIIDLGSQQRYAAYNNGTGPAFVRAMRVDVDGKPVKTWNAMLKALDVPVTRMAYSNLNHVPVAANETMPIMIFDDANEFHAFEKVDPRRYEIDYCYCSVLEECWQVRWRPDLIPEPKPVGVCRVDPASEFEE
jgi:hypothetical protein